jgi:hypothetical protein
MKKLIGFLVLLFLGISLLSSCTDEVIPDINNNSIEYLEKVASEIGKQHNQSLDFVFQELKNNGTIVTKNQMKQVLKTGIDKFSRTIERDQQILDLANEKANEEINKYFMGVELNKRLFVSTPIKGIVDQYDSLLSDLLRKKLLVSDAIVNQFNGVNGMDIVLELDRLKQAGKHELNYDDLFIFLTAIEVGKNSIQYWTENKQEWEMLLNASNNSRILKPFSWGEVAGVDVAGAVCAAVSTALL